MNPKAVEALQKAKALFAHPAEVRDDIPEQITQAPEPIRKPRVVLLPPNAPKFDQHSMKEEYKKMEQPKQIDKYVGMSTNEAVADCIKQGISKPSDIAKATGKKVEQIYTSLWNIRKGNIKKFKKVAKKMPPPYASVAKPQAPQRVDEYDEYGVNTTNSFNTPKSLKKAIWEAPRDDFHPSREPTAWEDAHHVVLKSRDEYEAQITEQKETIMRLHNEITRLKIVVEYLEGRTK